MTPDEGLRFEVENPQRTAAKFMIPFTVLFIAWVPLTWFYGNITERSVGVAVLFFGSFAAFLVFLWLPALRRTLRTVNDPELNYILVGADAIEVALAGARTRRFAFDDIRSLRLAGKPRLDPGRRSEMVRIDLRRIDWLGGFTQGQGFRTLLLRAHQPAALVDAIRGRLQAT